MALILGKRGSRKRVTFRVPDELWEEYQEIKNKALEKGYTFNPTPELIETFKKSLEKAKKELESADT